MLAIVTLRGAEFVSVRVLAQETDTTNAETTSAEETSEPAKDCTSSEKFNNPARCVSKEPNPVLPEMREIVWGLGAFLVLFLVIRLVAYPRLKDGMDARAAKIAGDLDAADRARASVGAEREAYAAKIAAARAQGASLVDAARSEVEATRGQRLGVLNAELAQLRAAANAEVDESRTAALASMRESVVSLAVGAAERVVSRPIDVAGQRSVVDRYLQSAEVN